MRKLIALLVFVLASVGVNAQYKKDGTPDMRYRVNKQMYGNTYTPSYSSFSSYSYSRPKTRNYNNGGTLRLQNGYYRSNGTYVRPHIKTRPDNYRYNNYNNYPRIRRTR